MISTDEKRLEILTICGVFDILKIVVLCVMESFIAVSDVSEIIGTHIRKKADEA